MNPHLICQPYAVHYLFHFAGAYAPVELISPLEIYVHGVYIRKEFFQWLWIYISICDEHDLFFRHFAFYKLRRIKYIFIPYGRLIICECKPYAFPVLPYFLEHVLRSNEQSLRVLMRDMIVLAEQAFHVASI